MMANIAMRFPDASVDNTFLPQVCPATHGNTERMIIAVRTHLDDYHPERLMSINDRLDDQKEAKTCNGIGKAPVHYTYQVPITAYHRRACSRLRSGSGR